ncbi:MAG TPA: glycosyltransferase family 2 protein, partial [Solirubrobacteraceae bacterium]
MDAERWRANERDIREAVRSARSQSEASGAVGPATTAAPLASVIVVCWNSGDVLGGCLDRLLAQDYTNYEIVVVDDGSRDDTLAVAERRVSSDRELKIVRSRRNRGCPAARNLGLEHARGEIVAFIDADGFAAPGWLRQLVAVFDADETVGGAASTVFFAENPLVLNGAGGTVNRQGWAADLSMNESYERAEIASEALYPMGCGMAVRRSALERVGPFDDRMLNYYDDVDYGIRLWRAGYRVVVADEAWIDHGFGKSGG